MKKTIAILVVLLLLAGGYIGLARLGYVPTPCALLGKCPVEGNYTVDRKVAANGKFFVVTHEMVSMRSRIFQVTEAQYGEVREGLLYNSGHMKGWKPVGSAE
jgi:hypothetical protein